MIWVECHPDKKLVEVLGFRGRHPKGEEREGSWRGLAGGEAWGL